MTTFETVRVAAVQATPEILDAEASVAKAVRLIGEAAAAGAGLVVLPEAFVSLYPSNAWARAASSFGGFDELWERMWASSIDVPGPEVDRLIEACRAHDVVLRRRASTSARASAPGRCTTRCSCSVPRASCTVTAS